jgi:hydrogenase maturation protein HypF
LAPCAACVAEVFDPRDRRYLYPFTSCVACGPRYTVIRALPFDRQTTSMADFPMCAACLAEYRDCDDRRFHSQLNTCAACGPRVTLRTGENLGRGGQAALEDAAAILRAGGVLLLKGVGGYQIVCDATHSGAVGRVRRMKARPHKPLALMFPDIGTLTTYCSVSPVEAELLTGAAAPIALVDRAPTAELAGEIAPGLSRLGAMLPASMMHLLLARLTATPLVVTSANRRGEPILTDDEEAQLVMGAEVDGVVTHDRAIVHAADDSVVQAVAGRPTTVRLGRGTAPLEVALPGEAGAMGTGGHLKTTVAVCLPEGRAVVSSHVGTLGSEASRLRYEDTVAALESLSGQPLGSIFHDLHPDYASTRWAEGRAPLAPFPQREAVQHHVAHVMATYAERGLSGTALGFSWDGWGLGDDGTLWGGECFQITDGVAERIGHLRAFQVPGGEVATRDPRRSAAGLLQAFLPDQCEAQLAALDTWREAEWRPLLKMMAANLNAPWTTSIGRLFDGVAALLGLCRRASFEGQAAMLLEAAAASAASAPEDTPAVRLTGDGSVTILDPSALLAWMVESKGRGRDAGHLALALHHWLAAAAVAICRRHGAGQFVVGGGVFQNRLLTELLLEKAAAAGIRGHVPETIPVNDGGLSFGQLAASQGARPCV